MNAVLFWFLVHTIFIAMLAAFIVLLVKKWGVDEWMQVHGDKLLSQLFSCDLCMSFWAAGIVSIIMVCVTGDGFLIFVPLLSTPVTRMLV